MHTDPLGDAPLSGDLLARESMALALLSVAGTALTVAHSLRARGWGRTVLFAALGIGLPVVGEYGRCPRPPPPSRQAWICCSNPMV